MKSKKAAVDVSFNWIFVLIAGAAILIFFIAMISSQKDKAETNIALTMKTELKSVFSGASLSQDRQLDIDTPKTSIYFTCDYSSCTDFSVSDNPSCYSQFEIGDTGINEQTLSQSVFAPSEISGKKIFTWTLPWNAPFFVSNFLFVTGADSHYLFIDSGNPEILQLFNRFPDSMNKDIVPVSDINSYMPEGSSHVKFIFAGYDASSQDVPSSILFSTDTYKISAVNIDYITQTIDFYSIEGDKFIISESLPYISDSEVYAAIFSENSDFYKCNMQKVFNRYHIITEIISLRSSELYQSYTQSACKTLYADYANGLKEIRENSYSYSAQSLNSIASAIPVLESANLALKEKSCPQIY